MAHWSEGSGSIHPRAINSRRAALTRRRSTPKVRAIQDALTLPRPSKPWRLRERQRRRTPRTVEFLGGWIGEVDGQLGPLEPSGVSEASDGGPGPLLGDAEDLGQLGAGVGHGPALPGQASLGLHLMACEPGAEVADPTVPPAGHEAGDGDQHESAGDGRRSERRLGNPPRNTDHPPALRDPEVCNDARPAGPRRVGVVSPTSAHTFDLEARGIVLT
jgi:hypothetical protein